MRNPSDEIIRHMTNSFLLEAYADWSDEHGKTKAGQRFTVETMPAAAEHVATEAHIRALELHRKIIEQWTKQLDRGFQIGPWALIFVWAYNRGMLEQFDDLLEEWAHNAVMSGVGHGVSWEDNREPLAAYFSDGRTVELRVRSCVESIEWEPAEEQL
jgi:hypothetical protein